MAPKQKKQDTFELVVADDTDAFTPGPLALLMTTVANKQQLAIMEEAENRRLANSAQAALARHAQGEVGKLARNVGAEFHRTITQHEALMVAAQGNRFQDCEYQFLRKNLEQEAQNLFALTDGATRNMHEQTSRPLNTPPPKRRGLFG